MNQSLPGDAASVYHHATDELTLPPDLERFAAEAVADGRYRDVADVIAAGVSLLQRGEKQRRTLIESVLAAEAEAHCDGCASTAEVEREMLALIERLARPDA